MVGQTQKSSKNEKVCTFLISAMACIHFFASLAWADTENTTLSREYSPDANTVLLLHMNESSWNGTDRDVIDSSGKGNNGVSYNGVNTTADGKFGRAGDFDGTDDYIECWGAGIDSLSFGANTDFTIECWVKLDKFTGQEFNLFVTKSNGDGFGYRLGWDSSSKAFFHIESETAEATVTSATSLKTGEWYHIAGTADRDGKAAIYVNGKLDGTPQDISGVGNIDISGGFLIGALNAGWYRTDGLIDEVRVSNRVRYSE